VKWRIFDILMRHIRLFNSFFITEMGDHLVRHGDGVKDIAFEVEDLDTIMKVNSVAALFDSVWFSCDSFRQQSPVVPR